MDGLIPILITWYFDHNTGDVRLDCWLDLDGYKRVQAIKMVYLRANINQSHTSLIHVPEGCDRETVEDWMKVERKKDVLELLNKAKVRVEEIIRKKHEAGNAMDFLMNG